MTVLLSALDCEHLNLYNKIKYTTAPVNHKIIFISILVLRLISVVRTIVAERKKGFRQTALDQAIYRNPFVLSLFWPLYSFAFDSRTTVSTCSLLSKLIFKSSSMIGSLKVIDFSHCPFGCFSS